MVGFSMRSSMFNLELLIGNECKIHHGLRARRFWRRRQYGNLFRSVFFVVSFFLFSLRREKDHHLLVL
jgi:hypothetical protein